MKLNYHLQHALGIRRHPFVLVGGVFFVILGLISRRIGGNPRQVFMCAQVSLGAIEQIVLTFVWMVSFFFTGAVFGAMFAVTERSCLLRANRGAVLVVLMHLFELFAYPLFFACYAWMLALLALILSLLTCVTAILTIRRVSSLAVWIMIVHIALLLWTIVRVASIIFMN